MAVLSKMIKANSGTDFAEEVVKIISKQDRVLKALDLDYRGGEGVYELPSGAYEVQLAGFLEDTSGKTLNSIKRALAKAISNGYDALQKAFENYEGVKAKVSLGDIDVEDADDPDQADGIIISILFDTNTGVNAKRKLVKRIKAESWQKENFKRNNKGKHIYDVWQELKGELNATENYDDSIRDIARARKTLDKIEKLVKSNYQEFKKLMADASATEKSGEFVSLDTMADIHDLDMRIYYNSVLAYEMNADDGEGKAQGGDVD